MVTGVNASVLATLQALEAAQSARNGSAQTPSGGAAAPDLSSATSPVVYAGAADAPSLGNALSVQDSLNRAASIADVGVNAGQTILGLVNLLQEKAAQAQAGKGDRAQLALDYRDLISTIDQLAKSAAFQGVGMLSGPASGDLTFKADASGESLLSLTAQDFTADGLGLAGSDLSGQDLSGPLSQVNAASAAVQAGLAQMRAESDQVQAHLGVVSQLAESLGGEGLRGQGDLDADSARLMALQVQQGLSGQRQALANQGPQALLALFRAGN